jgi:hypothetical protein
MTNPPPISGDGWTQDPKTVTVAPILRSVDGWTEKGARAAGWYADGDKPAAPVTVLGEAAKTGLPPGVASTVLGAFSYGAKSGAQVVDDAATAAMGWLGRIGMDALTFAAAAGVAALGFYLFATRGV